MSISSRPDSGKGCSLTSERDKNNMSLYGDQSDRPFMAPAFGTTTNEPAGRANPAEQDNDEDMPSNLMMSHSNVPGMTPQELMAAHRRSIAALPGNEDRELDLHSLTLSRHQVEPEDIYRADMDEIPDEEYQDCLNSFKFGQQADEGEDNKENIHVNQ